MSLGNAEDYEVIRIYTKCGGLVAKALIDKNLMVKTETYQTALESLPLDAHSLTPALGTPATSPLGSPLSDSYPVVPAIQFYISSCLQINTDCQVTVSSIQNGVNKFTVLKKSSETKRNKISSELKVLQVLTK